MRAEHSQQPEFGQRVRRRREELGFSQRRLAGDIVTASYISLLESGQRSPTLDLVLHLSEVLQMPLEELTGRDRSSAAPAEPGGLDLVIARSAARGAAELGDHAHAAELLATAYTTAVERGTTALQFDLGLALQEELRSAGRQPDRLALLERLADQEWARTDPHLRVVLFTELATAQRDTGRLTDARKSAYTALGELGPAELTGAFEHVRLLGILISVLCELNDLGQVELLLKEMLSLAEGHRPPVRGRAHWVSSIAYSQLGMATAARRHLDLARAQLTTPDTPVRDWLRFMRSAGNVLLDDGDPGAALPWLQAAEQVGPMVNAPDETTRIVALRARYELAVGAAAEVVEVYPRLSAGSAPLTGPDLVRANLIQAEALAELGRTEEAQALLRQTAALCDELTAYELAVRVWKRIDTLRS
ncbi:helix-turn-helix domain-containing protein [Streptomyces sp. 4503]|uniref:Helix-turn-helix domain-containing protein n=1 Tax=Streptomyces niphimycinicus TaxID=2842201 RepID=A0ABS6CIX2_9ACTN|nr:helix-turn-helix domain-containing protein [Streptomyces niphimycinicus]MBU3866886.1 helix-turn-helix domain-containing protein [Streptomyces niphimycinicus]